MINAEDEKVSDKDEHMHDDVVKSIERCNKSIQHELRIILNARVNKHKCHAMKSRKREEKQIIYGANLMRNAWEVIEMHVMSITKEKT